MSNEDADFITILSSDMIADIVQVYFDRELYTKKKVKIVDLNPQSDGYAFSLIFTHSVNNKVDMSNNQPSTVDILDRFVPLGESGAPLHNIVTPVIETIKSYTKYNAEQVEVIKADRDSKGRFTKSEVNK